MVPCPIEVPLGRDETAKMALIGLLVPGLRSILPGVMSNSYVVGSMISAAGVSPASSHSDVIISACAAIVNESLSSA